MKYRIIVIALIVIMVFNVRHVSASSFKLPKIDEENLKYSNTIYYKGNGVEYYCVNSDYECNVAGSWVTLQNPANSLVDKKYSLYVYKPDLGVWSLVGSDSVKPNSGKSFVGGLSIFIGSNYDVKTTEGNVFFRKTDSQTWGTVNPLLMLKSLLTIRGLMGLSLVLLISLVAFSKGWQWLLRVLRQA